MIKSMTAFARTQTSMEQGELVWEVRSVNHRFLEIHMKLPEEFRAAENSFRERIQAKLKRGKVECFCRFTFNTGRDNEIVINTAQAEALVEVCHDINGLLHQPSDVNPMDVLRWPGVVEESKPDLKPILAGAGQALDDTLDELVANREREGGRMRELLLQRCDAIADIVKQTRDKMPEILQRYQDRIRERLEELEIELNRDRLEQELVHLAQKMDVDEELDRLDSHLKEIVDVLDSEEAIGRRLDFLMQELNREANTLGSKSADISSTNASVELKVLIEQMREQIQNIE